MADTATRLLSGRAVGQVQPLEVHLVVTDRALLGTGDPTRSVFEPARVPGHGHVPAPVARAWVRDAGDGAVWLRRLYTSPEGRDLVAMDSRRRVFTGLLRRMLVLRDDVCATPWCGAPIVHADHTRAVREGGATAWGNGTGLCARCNQVKEAPGWRVAVIHPGPAAGTYRTAEGRRSGRVPRKRGPAGTARPRRDRRGRREPRHRPREIEVTTPTGHHYRSQAPPLTGWGWQQTRPPRRARAASRLERHLIRLLAGA